MSRRLIAFLIALVAIFFAFACLTAIRWPSMMMVVTLFFHPDPSLGHELVNWRELGFAYGAPYFLASLCFYASAATVSRKKGGLAWYLMGCASASPALFMVSFKDGWWMDPSGPQGILAGGALILAMLGTAVFLLAGERPASNGPVEAGEDGVHLSREQFQQLLAHRAAQPEPDAPQPVRRRRGPVPAAIARQRAQFAADGRRMLARQGRL